MDYTGPDGALGALRGVQARIDGVGVLAVEPDRSAARHAPHAETALAMERLLHAVALDPAVRVVLLRAGGEAFGAAPDEASSEPPARGDAAAARRVRAAGDDWRLRLLPQLPQPVVALVCGACAGEALTVIDACDIVVAADDARFTLAPRGDAVPGTAAKAAARAMAPRAAAFHALTGRSFSGAEAERHGLVTLAVPAAELEATARALAAELAAKDPLALRFTKETLRHVHGLSWEGVLSYTAAKQAELRALQAAGGGGTRAAAVQSFLAGKSKPGLGS